MKNNNVNNTRKGISFLGLLTIAFIVLKLVGVISWSWLWVLSPFWIPIVIALLGVMVFVIWLKK